MLKMINSLELGENTDTFRNLAKQFYVQNVQKEENMISSTNSNNVNNRSTTNHQIRNSTSQRLSSQPALRQSQAVK